MSYFSVFIACLIALFVHRYVVYLWMLQGGAMASGLNLASAIFTVTFVILFLSLPSEWSLPEREPTPEFSNTMNSAKQGDARSAYRIAAMYDQGEEVTKNKAKAVYWMRKAADKEYPEAEVALGTMYISGTYQEAGIPQDYRKGKELISKAAGQGHTWAKMLLFNLETEEARKSGK